MSALPSRFVSPAPAICQSGSTRLILRNCVAVTCGHSRFGFSQRMKTCGVAGR
jgi:hypothetical protein